MLNAPLSGPAGKEATAQELDGCSDLNPGLHAVARALSEADKPRQ